MVVEFLVYVFFFQAEDGIRDAQESRGLGDVYKRQVNDASFGSSSARVVERHAGCVDGDCADGNGTTCRA